MESAMNHVKNDVGDHTHVGKQGDEVQQVKRLAPHQLVLHIVHRVDVHSSC
eukprot:CAMPEP_0175878828 /NCGR_PEP_ID=MMETSP0107_2-20121207/41418_1 /TAXON_ID=195067 ORGANISM="Goniomonas pacifica, Strain CCMP1869" /NCGR_SAMPLE_ID=MMETSP0107_2 /ASSEMBLY_ACC=CAM_ASM_000203 /LENGTH=50 /DNA_ID=CAMNT_0017198383 /DNA_START=11 /DNA_END=160 /DNA_ORIENTATION=-